MSSIPNCIKEISSHGPFGPSDLSLSLPEAFEKCYLSVDGVVNDLLIKISEVLLEQPSWSFFDFAQTFAQNLASTVLRLGLINRGLQVIQKALPDGGTLQKVCSYASLPAIAYLAPLKVSATITVLGAMKLLGIFDL